MEVSLNSAKLSFCSDFRPSAASASDSEQEIKPDFFFVCENPFKPWELRDVKVQTSRAEAKEQELKPKK